MSNSCKTIHTTLKHKDLNVRSLDTFPFVVIAFFTHTNSCQSQKIAFSLTELSIHTDIREIRGILTLHEMRNNRQGRRREEIDSATVQVCLRSFLPHLLPFPNVLLILILTVPPPYSYFYSNTSAFVN